MNNKNPIICVPMYNPSLLKSSSRFFVAPIVLPIKLATPIGVNLIIKTKRIYKYICHIIITISR